MNILNKNNNNSKVKWRGENNMNILNKNNNNWTSKTELMIKWGISSDTIDQIISDFISFWSSKVLNGTKKGGFHNLETYYNNYLTAVITSEVETGKYNTNQITDATKEAKEQGILLNTVINSGDLKAAKDLCDLIMEKTQIQAENKKNVRTNQKK